MLVGLNWKGDILFKFSCQSDWYGSKSRNEKSLGFGSGNRFSSYPSTNQDVITGLNLPINSICPQWNDIQISLSSRRPSNCWYFHLIRKCSTNTPHHSPPCVKALWLLSDWPWMQRPRSLPWGMFIVIMFTSIVSYHRNQKYCFDFCYYLNRFNHMKYAQ